MASASVDGATTMMVFNAQAYTTYNAQAYATVYAAFPLKVVFQEIARTFVRALVREVYQPKNWRWFHAFSPFSSSLASPIPDVYMRVHERTRVPNHRSAAESARAKRRCFIQSLKGA